MGNRNIELLVMLLILVTTFAVAQPIYEQGSDVTLSVPCYIDGNVCGVSATCNGTVLNPRDVVLYNEQSMVQNGAVFELDLNSTDTQTNGDYRLSVSCSQGGESESKNLIFSVTPNGEELSVGKGISYGGMLIIMVIFFIICLYGGYVVEWVAGRSAFFLIAYLLLIGITFISWNLSLDYFTSAPFIASFFHLSWLVLMYALFPVILLLTFYTVWMMLQIKAIQDMVDKGMEYDEAYERTVKSGLARRSKW